MNANEPGTSAAVSLLRGASLRQMTGVEHGFTTRNGGVSVGALASLNLALRGDERPASLRENWRRVVRALHPGWTADRVAVLHQVHGAFVARVTAPGGPAAVVAEADAAVTTEIGIVLAVRTADCVPVLLAAPGGVAVAHAGWRGTVQGVVPAAVVALCEATGADPAEVVAAIGPCVSLAAYEVGEEVVEALADAGLASPETVDRGRGPKPHVDLGAAVGLQLERAGVPTVDRIEACTVLDERFYSHRRDGAATGRLAGVIARSA